MTGTRKSLSAGWMVYLAMAIAGCNTSEEKKTVDEPAPVVFSPFKAILILHPVADFSKWKTAYRNHDSIRKVYGITSYFTGRGIDDSSMVLIANRVTEGQKAKDFADLPKLKEDMSKAGVTGEPVVSIVNVVMDEDSTTDQKERLMVSHTVSDFAAWKKNFAEGQSMRFANGLLDKAIARGLVDSNRVYVRFAVTDLQKARDLMQSAELKDRMTKAGVMGPPEIFFYRLVE